MAISIYVAGLKSFFDDIIFIDIANKRIIYFGGTLILVSSAIFGSLFGLYSLLIIPALIFAFLSIKYLNFPLLLFLAVAPFVITLELSIINFYNYGFVLWIGFLWSAKRLTASSPFSIRYSQILIAFAALSIFLVFISIIPEGINNSEFLAIIRFILFFGIVLMLYDILDRKDIFSIIIAMSIPVIVASYFIFSVYSHSLNLVSILELLRYKVTGFLPNANYFGLLLMIVLPFWISILLWWDNLSARISAGVMVAIFSLAMILTNSRSAILGFIVSLFAFSVWTKKTRYFIGISLLVVAFFVLVPQAHALLTAAFRLDRGTSSRTDIWSNTIEMIKENFWLGVGMGNYREVFYTYYSLGWERGFYGHMPHAHNFILSKIAEFGIFGICIIGAIYYLPMRVCLRALKLCKTLKDTAIMRAFTAVLISYYVHSIFEGGGMLQEARLYPEIIFWILFILALKMNLYLENQAINPLKI